MVHRLHPTHRSLPPWPPTEDPPAKVFDRDDFGVDDEGVSEAPSCRCVSEGPPIKEFGRGDVGIVVEDVGEGDAILDAKGVGKTLMVKVSMEVVLV